MEGEKRLWEVSEEIFEGSCDDIDIFHFAKLRQSLSSDQLLLQLLHQTLVARDSVQADLGPAMKKFVRL